MSGVNNVKDEVKIAKNEKKLRQKQTVLFIDEVHRFNKAQQVCLILCIGEYSGQNYLIIPQSPKFQVLKINAYL